MKYLIKIGVLLVFFGWAVQHSAQPPSSSQEDEAEVRQIKDFVVGGGLHTMGWGITARYGNELTIKERRFYEASLIGFKHPKEMRRQNKYSQNCFGGSKSAYVYGKQNSFYSFRAGIGKMKVLYKKAEKNGIQVRYFYAGGASLGMLKPYYLDIIYRDDQTTACYAEHESYDPSVPRENNRFLKRDYIYGSSGFSYGLSEMRFHPGAYGKIGLNFEWSQYHDLVKAIEIGAAFDLYYKEAPIMIELTEGHDINHQLFATLYVDILFGWNW